VEALRDGRWCPDPLILDDQALAPAAGSWAAGAQRLWPRGHRQHGPPRPPADGVERVAAIVGGFHLSGPMSKPIIGPNRARTRGAVSAAGRSRSLHGIQGAARPRRPPPRSVCAEYGRNHGGAMSHRTTASRDARPRRCNRPGRTRRRRSTRPSTRA
jgi:hypothetical protein